MVGRGVGGWGYEVDEWPVDPVDPVVGWLLGVVFASLFFLYFICLKKKVVVLFPTLILIKEKR